MPEEQSDPAIDGGEFRSVLGMFPTGVTVVTAVGSDGPVGVAIGSFGSISLDPPLVGFYLGVDSYSGKILSEAGQFCVNVLCADQQDLCGQMASRSADKFDGVDWTPAPSTGAPVLPDVHAVIDCRLERMEAVGDHNLIVGRVLHLSPGRDAAPMVFYKGQYGSFEG